MSTPTRTRSRLADGALVLAALVITVLFAGADKPLWIDEFLHFAMAGMNLADALHTIWATTSGDGVNWGQTGAYFLLDYALGSVFGASTIALRMPSILAAFALLMSAVMFLRLNGLSRWYQGLVLMAFAGQGSIMYYAGEARPYMPMASFAVASLVYYRFPLDRRRTWLARCFGIYGVVIGSVFHPYYVLFLPIVLGFSFWRARRDGSTELTRSDVVRFAQPTLVIPGLALFIAVGALTWLKSRTNMDYDTLEYAGSLSGLAHDFYSTHLPIVFLLGSFTASFVSPTLEWFTPELLTAPLFLVVLTVLPLARPRWRPALTPPVVLLWLGLGTTVALSLMSYWQHYWILARQWLGGIAFATIAIVWFLGELAGVATRENSRFWQGLVIAFVGVLIAVSTVVVAGRAQRLLSWNQAWSQFENDQRTRQELVDATMQNGDWVYLGNMNVVRGGPVWPEVAEYYGVTRTPTVTP